MFLEGWVGGWMEVKAVLKIAYNNQKVNVSSQKMTGQQIYALKTKP